MHNEHRVGYWNASDLQPFFGYSQWRRFQNAIQTFRQEISGQMAVDLERVETRQQVSMEFKALSGAAREDGVQDNIFGMVH